MTWRWAIRDLWRHPVRTTLSVVGVAIASALLLDMMLLSGGLERSFEKLLLSRGFQLRVTPKGTLPFDTEATMGDATRLLAVIRADPGVAEAGPMLATSVFAGNGDVLVPLVSYGVDPAVQGIYVLQRGTDLGAADSIGMMIGEPAAARLTVAVGDTIRLVGRLDPQVAGAAADRAMVVRGVVRFLYDARDQPSIAVPIAVARELAGGGATDRASVFMVRAVSDDAVAGVVARVQAAVPAVSVNSIGDMVTQFRMRLSYFRQLSLILGAIALVVTVLLVGTLLAITVNERLGDIATMRAIGISSASILKQILAQGMIVTLVGGGGGIALGLLTAQWLDAILKSFPGLPASVSFFVADTEPMVLAATTLLLTGFLAGLAPAWRAARAPIADTLRNDAP